MTTENKKKGYVPLYHSVLNNPLIMKDADHLAVWCLLLLLANGIPKKEMLGGKPIMVKAGQFTTGRKQLCDKLNNTICQSKVERILNAFESEQQIEQQTKTTNRLIILVNWGNYKLGEQQSEQQVNNDRTTSEQRVNTLKESKERKKEKNNLLSATQTSKNFDSFWNAYPKKEKKKQALAIWKNKRIDKFLPEILEFISKAKYSDRWLEGFIKQPTTFLNGECWNDDLSSYDKN